MTRKRPKKHPQLAIATEAVEQQQRLSLKRQIAILRRLPKDFRDIDVGSRDWEAFADITGRRAEMEAWSRGPVVYFGELNKHEKMILGSPNKLVAITNFNFLGSSNWVAVITQAEHMKASWIYLPDEELPIITALNILFSRLGMNIRAKGQLMSEHTGRPVGVVY